MLSSNLKYTALYFDAEIIIKYIIYNSGNTSAIGSGLRSNYSFCNETK